MNISLSPRTSSWTFFMWGIAICSALIACGKTRVETRQECTGKTYHIYGTYQTRDGVSRPIELFIEESQCNGEDTPETIAQKIVDDLETTETSQ